MKVRSFRTGEVARISGVTIRTLHHYDNIGLLVPSGRSEANYRLYSEGDLYRLQQILLWRELGFSLEQIRSLVEDPSFDRLKALEDQRDQLLQLARRTDALIQSVDVAIESLKGGDVVDTSKLFDGFNHQQYEGEVRERWGDSDAYRESARRTKRYTDGDWSRLLAEGRDILDKLAEKQRQGATATQDDVVELAEMHRRHIDRWFYPCSFEAHEGLAELFLGDERYAANIDKHGDGLTRFLAEAIRANAAAR